MKNMKIYTACFSAFNFGENGQFLLGSDSLCKSKKSGTSLLWLVPDFAHILSLFIAKKTEVKSLLLLTFQTFFRLFSSDFVEGVFEFLITKGSNVLQHL